MKTSRKEAQMENQKVQEPEIFEELSVTELEDRLELASRCLCRINKDVAPATQG